MRVYGSYSDSELAFLLTQGDELAFTEIYNRFYGLLFIHASKRLNDDEEAKDVLHQLFESLWVKRLQVAPDGNLSAYLYTSVRNRVLDVFAHQKVESKYVDSLQDYIDQDHVLTDYMVREKQMALLIEQEIDALPPKMREIFILSRKEHKSHKEIALELGLSELTVKTQVKKALRILKSRLGVVVYVAFLFKIYR
ncbi:MULTISPECIES: RNA polymerase sigma factor [unclassified Pedobacter]|uniref:RNA polymerase sigma factor n=1 Tax=unclassified Pedobacter TaxID=2628915 RepID=UPI0014240B01|nr:MULTISPECIES: RNA polymerase sigma-70 factor [unclassified Pedobacter]NII83081.1 RNA polymerase sigma-70 factor (ECF subfamily) [Pedobacter sp. SG908]NMN37099.1 RNA polymerase sigma-70 factor (ECF subfamily) [Pedobacter sp. SG918]